jgi:hypothetical protein
MKVTGDQKGVLSFKNMYVNDRETAMSYLRILKKRKVVYFRDAHVNSYVLYSINAEDGDIFKITKFQEGQIKSDNK